jgi:hypothetical protein
MSEIMGLIMFASINIMTLCLLLGGIYPTLIGNFNIDKLRETLESKIKNSFFLTPDQRLVIYDEIMTEYSGIYQKYSENDMDDKDSPKRIVRLSFYWLF